MLPGYVFVHKGLALGSGLGLTLGLTLTLGLPLPLALALTRLLEAMPAPTPSSGPNPRPAPTPSSGPHQAARGLTTYLLLSYHLPLTTHYLLTRLLEAFDRDENQLAFILGSALLVSRVVSREVSSR
jgi:hypothetical protein